MDNTVGKVNSKITWQGVEVSGPFGKKEVKIEGDKPEDHFSESFLEGAFKGVASLALGPVTPFLNSAIRAYGSYSEGFHAAIRVGGDEKDAALKGAIMGALKGFAHGVLDFLVIKAIIASVGGLGGPATVIAAAAFGGGLYNIVKDAIRKNTMTNKE